MAERRFRKRVIFLVAYLVFAILPVYWMVNMSFKTNVEILGVFSLWGVLAIRVASPMKLFTILANVAGLVLVIAGIQIFLVNRRFLPRAVRPPLWRELLLLVCSAFYAFFTFFVVRNLFQG